MTGLLEHLYNRERRTASVRKYAATLVVIAALGVSACGGSNGASGGNGTPSTSPVATDLKSLLDSHSIACNGVSNCAHQNGNQFICEIEGTKAGKTLVNVTDDGSTIHEQGL